MQTGGAGTHPFAKTQDYTLLLRIDPIKTGRSPNQAKNQN